MSQNFFVKGINRELRPNAISLIQWDRVRISCIVCFIHEDQWLSSTRIIFCQTGCCDGVDGPYLSLGEPSACSVCSPLAHPFLLEGTVTTINHKPVDCLFHLGVKPSDQLITMFMYVIYVPVPGVLPPALQRGHGLLLQSPSSSVP